MDKRALYNLLRLSYQEDGAIEAESWQVEDYRLFHEKDLFSRLNAQNIHIDRVTFLKYIQNCEDPEDLTALLSEDVVDESDRDQIYLLIFELWRRFGNEKQSFSVFCDEFDRRIELYGSGSIGPCFALEDSIFQLQRFFKENSKSVTTPRSALNYIADRMANDLESFLYEYISDQVEMQNSSYASDLIEELEPYVNIPKWFRLLRAKLAYTLGLLDLGEVLQPLLHDLKVLDLEFGLEMMDFCRLISRSDLFIGIAKYVMKAIETDGDFQEFLVELLYFFEENKATEAVSIQEILDRRDRSSERKIRKEDPDLYQVWQLLIKKI